MSAPLVTNIQKFSIHDGKGIRTTIFFKGCPLRCRWCHNPETWSFAPELLFDRVRCGGCGTCVKSCPTEAISWDGSGYQNDRGRCSACGTCREHCVYGAREISGSPYDVDDLVRLVRQDILFYEESGGGVTLSGGEALAQDPAYMERLLDSLGEEGIGVNIDTCGGVPWDNFQRVLPYVDTFLYDVKCIDRELHQQFTGQDNTLILDNLIRLGKTGAKINIRVPVIVGFNGERRHMEEISSFVSRHAPRCVVNLIPFHNLGTGKFSKLGRKNDEGFSPPKADMMAQFARQFRDAGIANVRIGG